MMRSERDVTRVLAIMISFENRNMEISGQSNRPNNKDLIFPIENSNLGGHHVGRKMQVVFRQHRKNQNMRTEEGRRSEAKA